jgi:spermidine synthase
VASAWQTLEQIETEAGPLELRQRGENDFLITLAGRVLMNSHANRSEVALAQLACADLGKRPSPRVLIGGLGMGCTLRAALDALPSGARIHACEINSHVAGWCRGPLAGVNRHALEDPRVAVQIGDIAAAIVEAARGPVAELFDAILLDLYEGPHPGSDAHGDPFYGSRVLARTHAALAEGGVLAVWAEAPDRSFDSRLRAAGFETEIRRPGRGGLRHAIHLARRPGSSS